MGTKSNNRRAADGENDVTPPNGTTLFRADSFTTFQASTMSATINFQFQVSQ